jgi:hypothetical protein
MKAKYKGPQMAHLVLSMMKQAINNGLSVVIEDNKYYQYLPPVGEIADIPERKEWLTFLSFIRKHEWYSDIEQKDLPKSGRRVSDTLRTSSEDMRKSIRVHKEYYPVRR